MENRSRRRRPIEAEFHTFLTNDWIHLTNKVAEIAATQKMLVALLLAIAGGTAALIVRLL